MLSSKSWRCREKDKDGFALFSNMKVPDTNTSWISRYSNMTLEKCKEKCWENCSCTAYGSSDITGKGSGVVDWVVAVGNPNYGVWFDGFEPDS